MKELLAIKNKWLEESRKGCVDAFECALKEAYQAGADAQRESNAKLCEESIVELTCGPRVNERNLARWDDDGIHDGLTYAKAIRNNKESN